MWAGHTAYFEIADGAVVDFGGTTAQVDDGHGWIAVDEIRTSDQPSPAAPARPAGKSIAQTRFDLVAAIAALRAGSASAGRQAGGGRGRSRRGRSPDSRSAARAVVKLTERA